MNDLTTRGLILLGCAVILMVMRRAFKRHLITASLGPVETRNTRIIINICEIGGGFAGGVGLWFLIRGTGIL